MVTTGKYPKAEWQGHTCHVNLGTIHLEMRKETDKIKFHREQIEMKERSPVTDPWGNSHPWELDAQLPAEEDRQGWRGIDGVRARGSAGSEKTKQGTLPRWR